MKKFLTLLVALLGLTSCGVNGSNSGNTTNDNNTSAGGACGAKIDLDAINDYFSNDPTWLNLNSNGNKVTLIPFTHINGPKAEWNFFAMVNFEYDASFFYKYQVTYLSCTCRSAEVNYWQTAYVELTVPDSGQLEDVKLKRLSFDNDGTGHYLGGFWGDSGVNGYDINGSGITYQDIKDAFIPYLINKTYAQLSSYDGFEVTTNGTTVTYDDTVFGMDKEDFAAFMEKKEIMFHGDHYATLDDFNGASVSTNNILRMLLPLMEYHAANNI